MNYSFSMTTFPYYINEGDTIASIARYFNISIKEIINNNLNLDQNNLIPGSIIYIPLIETIDFENNNISYKIRKLLFEYVMWLKIVAYESINSCDELQYSFNKLLALPNKFKDINICYNEHLVDDVINLFEHHIVLFYELFEAVKNTKLQLADKLEQAILENIKILANYLNNLNEYWLYSDLEKMFYDHVLLYKNIISSYVDKEYEYGIDLFDKALNEIMILANYIISGIYKMI